MDFYNQHEKLITYFTQVEIPGLRPGYDYILINMNQLNTNDYFMYTRHDNNKSLLSPVASYVFCGSENKHLSYPDTVLGLTDLF